jgi:hypothetical protein
LRFGFDFAGGQLLRGIEIAEWHEARVSVFSRLAIFLLNWRSANEESFYQRHFGLLCEMKIRKTDPGGTLNQSRMMEETMNEPTGNFGREDRRAKSNGVLSGETAPDLLRFPPGVRASVVSRPGEYDARRLRSQREIIRDVMVSAAECETWLTLGELRALTRYGEASISAQLRHLRKAENGGYDVIKRHREGASPARPGTDGRSECVWEYRMTRGMCGGEALQGNSGGVGAAA